MARTRFIIYCQERTGSTLLVDLLNSHPSVHCEGEVLGPPLPDTALGPSLRAWSLRWIGTHQRMAWQARRSPRSVFGFKLLVYQVPRSGFWSIRTFHARGWRIINLRRSSMWRQALSNLLARTTRRYHRRPGQPAGPLDMELAPDDLVRELKVRVKRAELEHQDLQGLPFLELTYEEDLSRAEQWPMCLAKVCDYLGIAHPPGELRAPRVPTYDRPPDELIPNYRALVEAVARSPYARLVDDPPPL